MGRMYSSGTAVQFAVTAPNDLIQIVSSASAIAVIHEIRIGQVTEEGDAAHEMLQIDIVRFTTAATATAQAESPLEMQGGTAACTTFVGLATNISTAVNLMYTDAFNTHAGWHYLPAPEARIVVPAVAGEGVCVQLIDTPADSITFVASIVWEEIGVT